MPLSSELDERAHNVVLMANVLGKQCAHLSSHTAFPLRAREDSMTFSSITRTPYICTRTCESSSHRSGSKYTTASYSGSSKQRPVPRLLVAGMSPFQTRPASFAWTAVYCSGCGQPATILHSHPHDNHLRFWEDSVVAEEHCYKTEYAMVVHAVRWKSDKSVRRARGFNFMFCWVEQNMSAVGACKL